MKAFQKIYALGYLATMFLWLSACKKEEVSSPDLAGKWRFVGYLVENKIDLFSLKYPPYFITLQLNNTKTSNGYELSGQAVINTYSGTYQYDANMKDIGSMSIQNLVSTAIGGNKTEAEYEQKYLTRLQNATKFDRSSPKLLSIYLSNPKGEVMVFERLP